MKTASLIIGILLMVLAGIAFIVCLLLPGMNAHISIQEAMIGVLLAAVVFFLAFVMTIVSAIFVWKSRKTVPRK